MSMPSGAGVLLARDYACRPERLKKHEVLLRSLAAWPRAEFL